MPRKHVDHEVLYREIYDAYGAGGDRFTLDDVDAEWLRRVVITVDEDAVKRDILRAVKMTVDAQRTQSRREQLALPLLAPDDAYLVVGPKERVLESKSSGSQQLEHLALDDANMGAVFRVNQAKHERYRQLDPYYNRPPSRGGPLLHNDAVAAWWRDHPDQPKP